MTTPPLTPEDINRLRGAYEELEKKNPYAPKACALSSFQYAALLDAAEREQRYRQALHIAQPWLVKMQETCSDTGLRYAIMGVNDAIAPEPPELSGNTEQLPEPQKCETCNGSGVK